MPERSKLPDLKNEALDVIPRAFSKADWARAFRLPVPVSRVPWRHNVIWRHWLAGNMVILVATALPFDLTIRVALLFSVALVLFAEILNTALEAFVDLHIQEYHRLAMLAKDAAAAGVLVLALGTVIIFSEMIYHDWAIVLENQSAVWTTVVYGMPLILSEWAGLFLFRRNPFNY